MRLFDLISRGANEIGLSSSANGVCVPLASSFVGSLMNVISTPFGSHLATTLFFSGGDQLLRKCQIEAEPAFIFETFSF